MRKTLVASVLMGVSLSACGAAGVTATQPIASADPGYRANVLADRPVAFWPMDETSGTVMRDASGNGHDGAYTGSVAFAQAGPIKASPAAAIAFDGTAGWASVPDDNSFHLSTITIELWINKQTESEFGAYVTKNFTPGGGAGTGWFQLLNDHHDGRILFRVGDDDAGLVSATVLRLKTWYYVVATYDGTTARLFINGKLDTSGAFAPGPKQGTDAIEIGRRGDGLMNNATISGVAIYPSALTGDRVAAHWQAASSGR